MCRLFLLLGGLPILCKKKLHETVATTSLQCHCNPRSSSHKSVQGVTNPLRRGPLLWWLGNPRAWNAQQRLACCAFGLAGVGLRRAGGTKREGGSLVFAVVVNMWSHCSFQ